MVLWCCVLWLCGGLVVVVVVLSVVVVVLSVVVVVLSRGCCFVVLSCGLCCLS